MKIEIDSFVDSGFENQLEWLEQLVGLPSNTENKEDVERAAEFVDNKMEDLGFSILRREDPNFLRADHRIYSSNATSEEDVAICLVGHIDTVYPIHWEWERINENKIKGPGVMDMKGGLAVIVFALDAIKRASPTLFNRLKIRFIMNSDEEKGSTSSRRIFQSEYSDRISEALVFEPGRTEPEKEKVVVERKGSAPFEIVASVAGFPQHAGGRHQEGGSALHALMLLGSKIESMTDYDNGLTFNVTFPKDSTPEHGKRNVIPSEARFLVDCRYAVPGSVEAAIEKLNNDISNLNFDGTSDLDSRLIERLKRVEMMIIFQGEGLTGRPPMIMNKNLDLCNRYSRHAKECGLGHGRASLQGGVSDANFISETGIPVIDGLGPYGKNAHSLEDHDEWFDPESLRKRTKALARFLLDESG